MKILFAIHEDTLIPTNLDFTCFIARTLQSSLTGVIMAGSSSKQPGGLDNPHSPSLLHAFEAPKISNDEKLHKKVEELSNRFVNACSKREISATIHRKYGLPFIELILETRYADLLLMDARTAYPNSETGTPSLFLKKILGGSECPVIVLPEGRHEIREIIFTYDGEASSMFAIKQFTYLFPKWSGLTVYLIQADEQQLEVTNKPYLLEWLTDHYANVRFELIPSDASEALLGQTYNRPNSLVVMGAYGRKGLSGILKKSEGESLLKLLNQPIFIAHA